MHLPLNDTTGEITTCHYDINVHIDVALAVFSMHIHSLTVRVRIASVEATIEVMIKSLTRTV